MNINKINVALAVEQTGLLKLRHFGDADKYQIYEISDNGTRFLKEEKNPYKDIEHGSEKKGKAIMDLLSGSDIKLLVSRQFGTNIRMVNSLFIPVIVYSEEPEEVLQTLIRHIKWIQDELKNKSGEYCLFTVKKGIMKKAIAK